MDKRGGEGENDLAWLCQQPESFTGGEENFRGGGNGAQTYRPETSVVDETKPQKFRLSLYACPVSPTPDPKAFPSLINQPWGERRGYRNGDQGAIYATTS